MSPNFNLLRKVFGPSRPGLKLLASGSLLLLLTGCGSPDGTMQLPLQGSSVAANTDWLFYFIFWLNVFYLVHIMLIMLYFMWKYRRRPGHEVEESPHHSLGLEIGWTLPPVILVLFMFYWGFTGYVDLSTPPKDAYKIEVVGRKWSWEFIYPNGARTTELHVPKDVDVQMLITSEDVLHSFFIPKFRVKKDAVPGRTNSLWFRATRASSDDVQYTLYCAEYCGTSHSRMRANVVVHETQAEFDAWLAKESKPTPEKAYKLNCASCHNITGTPLVGPNFKGLYGSKRKVLDTQKGEVVEIVADENYILESIVKPGVKLSRHGREWPDGMTKTFGTTLSSDEINMLIEFIKSHKDS